MEVCNLGLQNVTSVSKDWLRSRFFSAFLPILHERDARAYIRHCDSVGRFIAAFGQNRPTGPSCYEASA
jgi:hypothetical protein